MLTQAATSVSVGSTSRTARLDGRLLSAEDPEATVERVLALLGEDQYLPARDLAAEALTRFPDHDRVQWAWKIFEKRGRSRLGEAAPEPKTDDEYEWQRRWLRNPPEWARGKWVALMGCQVVASAESLAEVSAQLRAREFAKRPLAVRVD